MVGERHGIGIGASNSSNKPGFINGANLLHHDYRIRIQTLGISVYEYVGGQLVLHGVEMFGGFRVSHIQYNVNYDGLNVWL